jgi:hypothetical protein
MWIVRSLWALVRRGLGLGHRKMAVTPEQPEQAARTSIAVTSTVRLEGEDDRPLMSSLAAQAPLMAGLARRIEPQDFMLAARLASVARLNPRAGRKTGPTEQDRAVNSTGNRPAKVATEVKSVRPGCLSPIAARGTSTAWRPRTAPGVLKRAA